MLLCVQYFGGEGSEHETVSTWVVLQCAAVSCSVLHYVAVGVITWRVREHTRCCEHVGCVAVCCSVLCCSVLRCIVISWRGRERIRGCEHVDGGKIEFFPCDACNALQHTATHCNTLQHTAYTRL